MTYAMWWIVEELDKAEKKYRENKKDADNGHMDCEQVAVSKGRMDCLKDVLLMYDKYSTIKRRDFNRNVERIQKAQRRKRRAVDPGKFLVDMKLFFFDVGVTRMKRIKAKMAGTWGSGKKKGI